jgi:osmotically-inducible protein OsmY
MKRRRTLVIAVIAALALATPLAAEEEIGDADNTERNEAPGLTATDQSSDPADIGVTREIRKRILSQDAMSTNAQNVKVITIDGVVTLRGPVESVDEQAAIVRIAQSVPDVKRVDNQLEIDAP